MSEDLTARASTRIDAPPERVWRALTDPAQIEQYYFGSKVTSDWKVGSAITWRGEWQGKPYEDKGSVVEARPNERLRYTHFSPLTGKPDLPENYHEITIDLAPDGDGTRVTLAQGGNADAKARDHSAENWKTLLDGLKKVAQS